MQVDIKKTNEQGISFPARIVRAGRDWRWCGSRDRHTAHENGV